MLMRRKVWETSSVILTMRLTRMLSRNQYDERCLKLKGGRPYRNALCSKSAARLRYTCLSDMCG
jgi:hypothetical protein